ncbi:MAG: ABC transporter permease [Bacteroidales bacterium]
MNKVLLIIKREYLTRVRKRSFIIMTILGPLLMASVFILPIVLSQMSDGSQKNIAVLDETGIFYGKFQDGDNIHFEYVVSDLESAKENALEREDYALLYIPKTELSVPSAAVIYSQDQPSVNVKSYIRNVMKKEVESLKLEASGVDEDVLRSIRSKISLTTIKIDESGEEEKTFTEVSMGLGIFASILIYMFIFIFGAQVMRGVIEEKSSRIVEIIVSSVKPFQLMLGKILGIAFVGLTQFLLWIVLTFAIVSVFQVAYADMTLMQNAPGRTAQEILDEPGSMAEEDATERIFEMIHSIDFSVMIWSFLFYFLGGYLLYAALFAAIGSAVDSEADTQQFMMPVTIPLILSIIMAQFVVQNPNGPVAFWFSIIPLTSPVIMMVRIPFGVPLTDLYLSIALLISGFVVTTWLAGKIYRTGILMYGKKISYKEIWKWIKY